ncbi:MAG: OsmC family protein [Bacteroidales bacterium]|nr:OsmC family protein [Bacteroidales bacterium]
MKRSFTGQWIEGMSFDVVLDGHHVVMDAAPEFGGNNRGPRPKELMVASLIGCTGMDVVSLLRKMRIDFSGLEIQVDTELTEEHPKHFTRMHLIYKIKGKNLPYEQIKKVIELSQEKYCGVSAVYKKAMELSYEILLVEE